MAAVRQSLNVAMIGKRPPPPLPWWATPNLQLVCACVGRKVRDTTLSGYPPPGYHLVGETVEWTLVWSKFMPSRYRWISQSSIMLHPTVMEPSPPSELCRVCPSRCFSISTVRLPLFVVCLKNMCLRHLSPFPLLMAVQEGARMCVWGVGCLGFEISSRKRAKRLVVIIT